MRYMRTFFTGLGVALVVILNIQFSKAQNNIRIDISSYPSGVYIAVLKDETGIVAKGKFVKR